MKWCVLLLLCALPLAAHGQRTADSSVIVITNRSQGEQEGRELVRELLSLRPAEPSTINGLLIVRDAKRRQIFVPVRFVTTVTPSNWTTVYEALPTNVAAPSRLTVTRSDHQPNQYRLEPDTRVANTATSFSGNATMIPFAGSDFSLGDLGLEFLHWPSPRIVRKEMSRSQFCSVLESVNPETGSGVYARVVSWIDHDSGGIVHAEAYDQTGNLLKEFNPKGFKKVKGEWQLREMEIRSAQAGTRTRIEFELDGQSGK